MLKFYNNSLKLLHNQQCRVARCPSINVAFSYRKLKCVISITA
jgi:hypothetical protein